MFGSCCGHISSNDIPPSSITSRPYEKPTPADNLKPTRASNKYGFQTILRPNGNGLLVVRKPHSGENSSKNNMTSEKPSTIHNELNNFHDVSNVELSVGASLVSSK